MAKHRIIKVFCRDTDLPFYGWTILTTPFILSDMHSITKNLNNKGIMFIPREGS